MPASFIPTTLLRDLPYALRTLARNPLFALVGIPTALALGIGANTAIFTVVNSVLLEPLHFQNPQQLVVLRERNLSLGFPEFSIAPGNFIDYRDHNHAFAGLAAFRRQGLNLSGGAEPERDLRRSASHTNFFDVLGRQPALGRTFSAAEMQRGNDHVAILSHGLWQRRFAGSRDVLGQPLKLNEEIYIVVGVMPPDFRYPQRTELWTPFTLTLDDWQRRGGHYINAVCRLREGATLDAAQADLNAIAARAAQQFPGSNRGWDTTLKSLQESVVGRVRPAMMTLTAAVGFVLLIACVNLANLLLSRAAVRRREIGIRSSLGAGRGRLVRQLLTESVLLATLGAAAGLALAWAGTRALVTLSPDILPRAEDIALNGRALAFTAAIAIVTRTPVRTSRARAPPGRRRPKCGPARRRTRRSHIGFRRNRLRSVLVCGEVALALVLLSGAGLLMRSFYHLQSIDPGFDPHHVLTFRTNLPGAKYKGAARVEFYQRALTAIRALPGVVSAGASEIFPLTNDTILSFQLVGKPPATSGNDPSAMYYSTATGYFSTLRIPILSGRDFSEHDSSTAPAVAIVSQGLARKYYPNENPLGQRIRVGGA